MGIEWFRDLSIIILGVTTSVVLIFIAVLVYRLYRKATTTLQLVKATVKIAYTAISLAQQGPLATIMSFVQGLRSGFEGIRNLFKKESNKGECKNE